MLFGSRLVGWLVGVFCLRDEITLMVHLMGHARDTQIGMSQ